MGPSHESIGVVKTKGVEEQMVMLGSKVEQVWRGSWKCGDMTMMMMVMVMMMTMTMTECLR